MIEAMFLYDLTFSGRAANGMADCEEMTLKPQASLQNSLRIRRIAIEKAHNFLDWQK